MFPANLSALCSSLCFSTGSVGFTYYARKLSPQWVNAYKAFIALIAFGAACLLTGSFTSVNWLSMGVLFLSGLLGLMIGDTFLLMAFATIGSARTLMMYAFHPIFLGVMSYFLFAQALSWQKLEALVFTSACLFTISYERYRKEKKWEIRGLVFALICVLFDAIGVLLTRYGFDHAPSFTVLEGNFYRTFGAVCGFIISAPWLKFQLVHHFKQLKPAPRLIVSGAALLGTFVSLSFWLYAVRNGHLATVSAIAGCSPVFASALECVIEKKKPSRYLFLALAFFGVGFYLLL
jgi:drug/metabolite transporter (DMT)-like permease